MHFLYNLAINLYGGSIWIASFFNLKAQKWIKGRKDFFKNLPELPDKEIYWFHCASLGEFDMGLPVMRELKRRNPDCYLVVTFFSPSGFDHYNKRDHQVDLALHLPLDTKRNAVKFLDYLKPSKAFFVKYEFWINYLLISKQKGTKLYSICTILRQNQRFFKWYGSFFRNSLRLFDHFYVQDNQTHQLLNSIGIAHCSICGDTRFDQVLTTKIKNHNNPRIEQFLEGKKAFIIGSSWEIDEKLLFNFIKKNRVEPLIIAPHNISEENIVRIERSFEGMTQRYTEPNQSDKNILIINTIGHLSSAYKYASIAYVGGGFTGKLHNILEPAVYGLPILFGPRYHRFPEAEQFISSGIAFSIDDEQSLTLVYNRIISQLDEINAKALSLVSAQSGAAAKIVNHLEENNLSFPVQ
jgi:3-deoxy-D-manno-octulosonic-acid transferase